MLFRSEIVRLFVNLLLTSQLALVRLSSRSMFALLSSPCFQHGAAMLFHSLSTNANSVHLRVWRSSPPRVDGLKMTMTPSPAVSMLRKARVRLVHGRSKWSKISPLPSKSCWRSPWRSTKTHAGGRTETMMMGISRYYCPSPIFCMHE